MYKCGVKKLLDHSCFRF